MRPTDSGDGTDTVIPHPVIPLRNPGFTGRQELLEGLRRRLVGDGQPRNTRISNHLSVLSDAQTLRESLDVSPEVWGSIPPWDPKFTGDDVLLIEYRASLAGSKSRTFVGVIREVRRLLDELHRQLDRDLQALIKFTVRSLNCIMGVGSYEFVSTVPPHAMSPCGVIRLSAPTVPRAPGCGRSPSTTPVNDTPAA